MYAARHQDDLLSLKAAGAVTATATHLSIDTGGTGLYQADVVIDLAAMSGNALFVPEIQGSNVADFSSGVQSLWAASWDQGASAAPAVGSTYSYPLRNSIDGKTFYRYLRMKTSIAGGSSPSINYKARLAVGP